MVLGIIGAILLVLAIALGLWFRSHRIDMRHGNKWSSLGAIPAAAIALLLVGALVAFCAAGIGTASADGNKKSSSTSSTSKPNKHDKNKNSKKSVEFSDEFIANLRVRLTSVDCPSVVVANGGSTVASAGFTTVKYNQQYLLPSPPRPWTDSPMLAFVHQTVTAETLEEAKANICWGPLYGGMVANFFANMDVDGLKLVDINPWLRQFAGDPLLVNQTVYDNYVSVGEALDTWMRANPGLKPDRLQVLGAAKQNIAWQQYAEKLGTLLTRFQLVGYLPLHSVKNLHLAADGASAGNLPAIGYNPLQEDWPALILQLTNKGSKCGPVKVIGLNMFDKRPEEFASPKCESPHHAPAPKPTPHHGGGSGNPTTTTRPRTSSTTRPTSTTTQPGRKCCPTTTVPRTSDTTQPARTSTTSSPNNSGPGAPHNGGTTPTTSAPPDTDSTPTTSPPTSRGDA